MTFQKESIRAVVYATLLALAIALPVVVRADAVSPDTILANPSQYDTQSVTVTGTAKNVTTRQSRRGTVVRYDLCGTACLHVIDFTGATVTEGAATTVTGSFRAHIDTGRFSADNTVMVGSRPGGPRGPGGPGSGSPPPPPPPSSAP